MTGGLELDAADDRLSGDRGQVPGNGGLPGLRPALDQHGKDEDQSGHGRDGTGCPADQGAEA